MKPGLYVICLLLSLPNLIAGVASLILRHTFATRNPLQIVTDFLFQVVWGLPLAGSLFVLLLIFGILAYTRPYAAMFAFVLNVTALALFLSRFGLPRDPGKGIVFVPVAMALIGFAFIVYSDFKQRSARSLAHAG
jgi:hypothetical protein